MSDNRTTRFPGLASCLRLWGFVAVATVASAATAQMSVPPAEYRPALGYKAEAATGFLLPQGSPVRRIALPQPTAAEAVVPKASRPTRPATEPLRNKSSRLAVGFARAVPAADRSVPLADLRWQTTAAGTRAAQLALTSPGAAAVRLGLVLKDAPPGLAVRFQGSVSGASTYGPFTGAGIAGEDVYWSPALEGETGNIEFELPGDVSPGNAQLGLPMLSHLNAAGRSVRAFADNIGLAESCEVDIACLSPALQQQLSSATNAVARMMVTIQGNTYLCSGTLLNDSLTSFTPYFLTADHCLEETDDPAAGRGTAAASASTINTYWFFQAATCGSLATPDYVLLVGGAKLLARSVDFDWALVKLNVAPPRGVTFAAWSAEGPMSIGTAADAIHHPSGDLKKFSQGNILAYRTFSDGSSFVQMGWTSGATEPGSSGSGLFTFKSAANYFEIRGTLSGGDSSCTNQQGTDYYSRLDNAYPLVAQYLAPTAANPARTTPVIEYYNGVQDAYFITVDPYEIAGRDNGSPPGWVRTGYRFLAYADLAAAPAGAQPVCRLYSPPPYGDTRFYSASPQECAAMLTQSGQHFIVESAAAFYMQVPAPTGTCPVNTRPVYRFLDTSSPPRRRYTGEVDLRDSIISDGGWTLEGVGRFPDQVAMCAPLTGAAVPATKAGNYQGLWWNPLESGWGINFAHQGDVIFATWFTYDAQDKPWWLIAELHKTTEGIYSGFVSSVTGPPFNAVPFDPGSVVEMNVGIMTVTFADATHATLDYTVNGVKQYKAITPQVFGPMPSCVWGAQTNLALATNFQDLWWNPQESGWGINFTHQGDIIFATWFTYDAQGKPWWLIAELRRTTGRVYVGPVSTVVGPPFNAVPWDKSKVVETIVDTATVTFADGNNATFEYTVNGISQTKVLTRQVFAPPGTVCQ